MITVLVDTDKLNAVDLANCIELANRALIKWAPKWNLTVILTSDPKVPADMVMHITDEFRHTSAYGYHTVNNTVQTYNVDGSHTIVPWKDHLPTTGEPTSYISPSALLNNVYGTYTKPRWSIAIWNLTRTKITRASKQTSAARYKEGIVGVLIHELMEMLADAHIDQLSKPDSTGATWLIEVADHVSGTYSLDTVNGKQAVIPGGTFPSYYNLKGQKPFDTCNWCTTPFDTTAPTFYGYIKSSVGVLIKIVKSSIHH